jgi:excisionase family DNA binding protein
MTERLGYPPKEVARKLGLNEKTIYDAIRAGEIPALRIGRRIIITAPVLQRLLHDGNTRKALTAVPGAAD